MVEMFARTLQDQGRRVAILDRGYKSKKAPLLRRLQRKWLGLERRMPRTGPCGQESRARRPLRHSRDEVRHPDSRRWHAIPDSPASLGSLPHRCPRFHLETNICFRAVRCGSRLGICGARAISSSRRLPPRESGRVSEYTAGESPRSFQAAQFSSRKHDCIRFRSTPEQWPLFNSLTSESWRKTLVGRESMYNLHQ